MTKKKVLAMAVWAAVASIGFVMPASAEETMSTDVNPVLVEGQQDVLPGGMVSTKGAVGILGDKDVMDTPFTNVNLTSKTIEQFGGSNQPLQSILVNNPSVRSVGTNLHNDYSIRGLKQTGTSMYVNGIPGLMTQFWAPTFFASDIQFVSGPNSGISGLPSTYETSAAGGFVNVVSKKATEKDITRYKQTFSGKGSLGEYLDVGRRFGKNNEWGVRLNTELLNGKTAIDEQRMKAQGIFANIDRTTKHANTNLLAGYRHLDIEGGARWFTLKNSNQVPNAAITGVPKAPNSSKNFGFDGIEKESEGFILAFNHKQKINDNWNWFVNAGYNHNKLNKNVIGASSNFVIINDAGDISTNLMSTQTVTRNIYAQIGTNGQFKTGAIEHDVTLALDKAWHSISGAKNNHNGSGANTPSMGSAIGNLYTGVNPSSNFKLYSIETGLSSKDNYWGLSIADTLKYKKSQLLLGLHKHASTVDSYKAADGTHNGKQIRSAELCPTYGYVYSPNENTSLYISHSEQYDKGQVSTYAGNLGETLDPAKTKQNEIGIKYQNKGFMANFALFDIKQANNFKVTKSDGLDYLVQDGQVRYKGAELSANGRIAKKWNLMGGLMILNPEQERTENGKNDGKRVNGVAKFSAVSTLEYCPDEKLTAFGRMVYTGKSKIFNETFDVPSSTAFDLGLTYKTKVNNTPVKLSAICYNLFDKDYWTAHTGNGLILSNPRTFFVSATFDF